MRAPLNDEEQLLLMQYLDGECGLLARVRVRALLNRNELAREFLESSEHAGALCAEILGEGPQAPHADDMWDRVCSRLEQEQRAAMFLGKRALDRPSQDVAGMRSFVVSFFDRMMWGVGGAAVAAIFLLTIAPELFSSSDRSGALVRSGSLAAGSAQPVSFATRRGAEEEGSIQPRILDQRGVPSAVEVDWVRGGGRVRVIPDESERAPIIWVKRNQRALALRSSAATRTRSSGEDLLSPLMSGESPELFDVERSTLERPVGGYFGQE